MFAFQSCGPFSPKLYYLLGVDEVGPFCTCSIGAPPELEFLYSTIFRLPYGLHGKYDGKRKKS